MIAVDAILELLKNGEWHGLKEIAHGTRLQEFKIELITGFLAEFDFLEFDKKNKRVKLSPQLLLFLKKIEDIEREVTPKRRRADRVAGQFACSA